MITELLIVAVVLAIVLMILKSFVGIAIKVVYYALIILAILFVLGLLL